VNENGVLDISWPDKKKKKKVGGKKREKDAGRGFTFSKG